jgi:hypothetical protein
MHGVGCWEYRGVESDERRVEEYEQYTCCQASYVFDTYQAD